MNSTVPYSDPKLRESFDRLKASEISSFPNDYLHRLYTIIGLIIVIGILVFSCIKCSLYIRRIYRNTDLHEQSPTSLSNQRLLDNDQSYLKV
jgi:hypothetical protein